MSLQEALKLLRLELGMTQEDLARQLNKAFVTVNRWENGKGFPSRNNAKSILQIAKERHASDDCVEYLAEVLLCNVKRSCSAAKYGFPDIDRELLFQLTDGSTNGLYVVEKDTYRLLYVNRKAEQMAVRYLSERGARMEERRLEEQADRRCFHYFGDRNAPCAFCPLAEIDANGREDASVTVPENGKKMHVHVKVSEMRGRAIYIIYLTDITQEDAERNALYTLTNDIPVGAGIYQVYLDARIELVFMNAALYRLIGEERGRALLRNGPSDICLVHPEDKPRLMAELRASIAEKRDVEIEMRMRTRNNEYDLIRLNAKMIKKGKEKLTYYCLFHELGSAGSRGEE